MQLFIDKLIFGVRSSLKYILGLSTKGLSTKRYLVKEENIERDGVKFSIQRYTKGKWLCKDIQFQVDKHN